MIRIYIDQSQKAYSELYLFLQSDIKTMCLEEGCYLGDPSEERVNQSTEMDVLSFFEAWFLQCETFGEFARQSARNTLTFATGCFVTEDYKFGCHRVLQAIKEADELDVTVMQCPRDGGERNGSTSCGTQDIYLKDADERQDRDKRCKRIYFCYMEGLRQPCLPIQSK